MNKKCSVLIVDDHDMFRAGVKVLLNSTNTIEIVAEAKNGKEFLEIVGDYKPDVVLMDISMPEIDGIEATQEVLKKYPNLKILALSMFGDEKYYFKMINAGVKGFVLKSSGISELEKAISEVAKNESYFSSELLRQIITNLSDYNSKTDKNLHQTVISKRELEVLKLITNGLSNEEISKKLNISITTVKSHRSSLLNKTSCNNTASLVIYAIKNNIIDITKM